jgi:hypothetical protein
MGDKKLLHCPHCNSSNIVHNGRPHQDKKQFYCKTCGKYFSKDALKGYPPSNIPFPAIAYLLYFKRKVPEFSNMRKYRKFVNYWLTYLKIHDKEVSRQTLHHWFNNFDSLLDKVISFNEARSFVHNRLEKVRPIPSLYPISYGQALKILERKYGKAYLVSLIKSDEEFFKEFAEIVSKHGVFSWEFLEAGYKQMSGSKNPVTGG